MTTNILVNDWAEVGRAAALAVLAYGALVAMLRASGKRTLTKLNVFDFVFVVALGSALASIILNPGVSLATGLAALATLMAVQVLLSWLCVRSAKANRWINGEPVLVLHRGRLLRAAMRRERVTEEEVRAAVRNRGLPAVEAVEAVVLETDGTFSVVGEPAAEGDESALVDVAGHPGRPSARHLPARG